MIDKAQKVFGLRLQILGERVQSSVERPPRRSAAVGRKTSAELQQALPNCKIEK